NKSIRKAVKESNFAAVSECVRRLAAARKHRDRLAVLATALAAASSRPAADITPSLALPPDLAADIVAAWEDLDRDANARPDPEAFGVTLGLVMIQLCL
ncbi:hypothetical protein HK405_010133, partial [Cladochytrium tenue]